jgi:two-component system nitrogen regulation sensor histidine kinase NtrY
MSPTKKSFLAVSASLAAAAGVGVLIDRTALPFALALGASMAAALLLGVAAFWLLVRPKLLAHDELRGALCRVNAAEQRDIVRRKLLEAIGAWAPVAILVYSDSGRIVYTNDEARQVFFESRNPEGGNFLGMLQCAPAPLRAALLSDADALFTLEENADRDTYNLSKRYFDVEGESYTLVTVKQLTREFGRREAEVYKRVIRVISHEFNNSLAPIISLIRSARLIARKPEHLPKLDKVLDTVEERATHLNTFLEGYASFARLPQPRPQVVSWASFLEGIKSLWPSVDVGPAPSAPGYFDAAQMQQVLINLLKNADEAKNGPGEVKLTAEVTSGGRTLFLVRDHGKGMTPEVLKNALEPFFSTKERGSGVGLALCREIVEAHNGRLKIEPAEGGGTVVSLWVPGRGAVGASRTGRLTLTRG